MTSLLPQVAPLIARSLLFVPGDRPERFVKATSSGAHSVIIDLEDAVAAIGKQTAREACRAFFAGGGSALVRVNAPDTVWAQDDFELCKMPGVLGVVLPKAESAADIHEAAQRIGQKKPILALIETALGMRDVHAIAAHPWVERLLFGTVDFCLDLGLEGDGAELASYRAKLVLASRAAGLLPPVEGVTLTLKDEDALRASTLNARRIGFGGKLCIHPAQVLTVNACFEPTLTEIAWAKQVLTLSENSPGAFELEGKMVDAPVIARARLLLRAREPSVGPSVDMC